MKTTIAITAVLALLSLPTAYAGGGEHGRRNPPRPANAPRVEIDTDIGIHNKNENEVTNVNTMGQKQGQQQTVTIAPGAVTATGGAGGKAYAEGGDATSSSSSSVGNITVGPSTSSASVGGVNANPVQKVTIEQKRPGPGVPIPLAIPESYVPLFEKDVPVSEQIDTLYGEYQKVCPATDTLDGSIRFERKTPGVFTNEVEIVSETHPGFTGACDGSSSSSAITIIHGRPPYGVSVRCVQFLAITPRRADVLAPELHNIARSEVKRCDLSGKTVYLEPLLSNNRGVIMAGSGLGGTGGLSKFLNGGDATGALGIGLTGNSGSSRSASWKGAAYIVYAEDPQGPIIFREPAAVPVVEKLPPMAKKKVQKAGPSPYDGISVLAPPASR